MMRGKIWIALLLAACVFVAPRAVGVALAETGDPVLINEVLAYHSGAVENSEFIELYGAPGTSLDGLSLIVVRGGPYWYVGYLLRRFDFDASHFIGPNGFFLLGNPSGLYTHYDVTPDVSFGSNYLPDTSITIALMETDSLAVAEGDTVTGEEIAYDAVGLNDPTGGDTFFYGASVIGPDGVHFPAGARRVEDGVDTDTRGDWKLASYSLPGDNTPTSSGPALAETGVTWGEVKSLYR